MVVKEQLATRLAGVGRRTRELLEPVDDDRLMAQPHELMSPLVWDYAHIAVYQELWLVQQLSGEAPVDPGRMHTYDAFEKPRRVRGSLDLMTRPEVAAYREQVDRRALDLLDEADLDGPDPLVRDGFVHNMIIEHEEQHQETILQALQLLPGGYHPSLPPVPEAVPAAVSEAPMVDVPGGRYPIGSSEHRPWDNEGPAHEVLLAPFRIDRHPVSCAGFLAFIEDGGYQRRELWSDAGWRWRCETDAQAPAYWRRGGDGWRVDRFGVVVPVPWNTPVMHVCWHEAGAWARWAGRRLPTEFEWEVAATWDPATGRARRHPWGDAQPEADLANLGQRRFGCTPIGSLPGGASALGCEQMIGDVWEWTSSDFLPYPGFAAFPYKEYSEVFFGSDHKVLRGASWAASASVARATFRNWDYPIRRQIFAGFRCASDGDPT